MSAFGTGIRRLCAVVAAPTATEMAAQIQAALRETPTIEMRLDWLRSDRERTRLLAWLRAHRPRRAIFLATCRRRAGGGLFPGNIQSQLDWLRAAGEAGCSWVDLEAETMRRLPPESIAGLGLPRILLSLHDFRGKHKIDNGIFVSLSGRNEFHGVKIAIQTSTVCDSFALLGFALAASARSRKSFLMAARNWVVVPMGDVALPARILALRYGSALAYAPVGDATAPGQVSLERMKHLYRAHQLTKRTRVYGVIGDPIGHSLSPVLHNTAFISSKIDAVFLPFLVRDLPDFLRAIPDLGIGGFSVTLPHKQSIIKHLEQCDPLAADIGAVNTVRVGRDGSLYGYNTDYLGVLRSLQRKLNLPRSRVLIFGAGGSARAAAFALARAGAQVAICARRVAAARELASAVNAEVVPRRALRSESFDAILNTTPIGMYPLDRASPLDSRELHCRLVMDLIYSPEKTQLLKLAARKGIATISGAEMFLAQGIAQWELWMKRRAPQAAMRRAVLAALHAQVPGRPAAPRGKR
jgi:3-dehydroquinate dehydratase/shikimate dehydrogenase